MMDFYTSPSFYLLLIVAVIPAAVLGLSGRRIRHYGFAVSVLFVVLLFSGRPDEALAFLLFLGVVSGATALVMREWRAEREPVRGAKAAAGEGECNRERGPAGAGGREPASVRESRATPTEGEGERNREPTAPTAPAAAAAAAAPTERRQPPRHPPGKRRLWVYRLSLAATVAPLVCYKFAALFDENPLGFIGLSYLTFKALQVLIEVRDGLIERLNPLDYLYFLLFFAPFTSGPIDRSRRFAQDAERRFGREEYADLLAKGIGLLLLGAVYKLVFATVASLNHTPEALAPGFGLMEVAEAVKDAWAFGLYLFFDFAGYSLMAIGAGCCFGIVTPPNFKAPFAARDLKDFWNRWHMTLSFWLRDFVFMRFTRFALKRRLFGSRQTVACTGYVLNMTLMGLWHGLTIDYLAYGLFHGLLLAATDVYQKRSRFHRRHKDARPYRLASWALTLNLVIFGFALFSGQARLILGGLLDG